MTAADQISEQDLHAYIDGQLPAARIPLVEAHLAANPDEAERLADYTRINDALWDAFPPPLDTPDYMIETVRPSYNWQMPRLINIAAGILLLAGGIGIGWGIKPTQAPLMMVSNAITAHATYAVEVLHPVEVASAEQNHLIDWLSKRLGAEIAAPDLTVNGFTLLGGRLLPGEPGPAAQFMYENATGSRVTLYVSESTDTPETAFKFTSGKTYEAFYWQEANMYYALVGDTSRESLRSLALAVYSQLI